MTNNYKANNHKADNHKADNHKADNHKADNQGRQAALTQERLKEVLDYNPKTGVFTWKVKPSSKAHSIHIGDEAGNLRPDGYRMIVIDGKRNSAQRLAYLFMEGYFPENQIDHLNGLRDDNRIANLREVSHRCNLQNCKINSNNTSGFPGVGWNKRDKNWKASIQINNKQYFLGYYDNVLDAALARLTAEIETPSWHCNHRGEVVKAIKKAWPGFNERCLG